MQITMKQLLIGITIIAGVMAALVRGHQLLGSHGLLLFSVFSVATEVLGFLIVRRWSGSPFIARLVGVCIFCLPLLPIIIPKLVMTDFDHMAYIASKERSANKLNRPLASDSRFVNVTVRYNAPLNRKGQWLAATGSVASIIDLESLREIVGLADDWHVEWSVLVSTNSNVKL